MTKQEIKRAIQEGRDLPGETPMSDIEEAMDEILLDESGRSEMGKGSRARIPESHGKGTEDDLHARLARALDGRGSGRSSERDLTEHKETKTMKTPVTIENAHAKLAASMSGEPLLEDIAAAHTPKPRAKSIDESRPDLTDPKFKGIHRKLAEAVGGESADIPAGIHEKLARAL